MVNRFPDAHLLHVILELFAAVQTNNIALAMGLADLEIRANGRVRRRCGQRKSRFSMVSIIDAPMRALPDILARRGRTAERVCVRRE